MVILCDGRREASGPNPGSALTQLLWPLKPRVLCCEIVTTECL